MSMYMDSTISVDPKFSLDDLIIRHPNLEQYIDFPFSASSSLPEIDAKTVRDFSALISVLFSRWLAMNYSEVLNSETGKWYAEQFKHFEKNILADWVKDERTIDYIKYL